MEQETNHTKTMIEEMHREIAHSVHILGKEDRLNIFLWSRIVETANKYLLNSHYVLDTGSYGKSKGLSVR